VYNNLAKDFILSRDGLANQILANHIIFAWAWPSSSILGAAVYPLSAVVQALLELHSFLRQSFPAVFISEHVTVNIVNNFSILFRVNGSEPTGQ
jgi:hypothetical protein